jgi:hypothetical protein
MLKNCDIEGAHSFAVVRTAKFSVIFLEMHPFPRLKSFARSFLHGELFQSFVSTGDSFALLIQHGCWIEHSESSTNIFRRFLSRDGESHDESV